MSPRRKTTSERSRQRKRVEAQWGRALPAGLPAWATFVGFAVGFPHEGEFLTLPESEFEPDGAEALLGPPSRAWTFDQLDDAQDMAYRVMSEVGWHTDAVALFEGREVFFVCTSMGVALDGKRVVFL